MVRCPQCAKDVEHRSRRCPECDGDLSALVVAHCPVCDQDVLHVDGRCPQCDLDLRPLMRIRSLADLCYNRALLLLSEGDTQSARESLSAALAADPRHIDALILLAKLTAKSGEGKQALSLLQRALDVEPESAKAKAAEQAIVSSQRTHALAAAAMWGVIALVGVMAVAAIMLNIAGITRFRSEQELTVLPRVGRQQVAPPSGAATPQTHELARRFREAVASSVELRGLNLDVSQHGSGLRIRGEVRNAETRKKVEAAARQIVGNGLVDTTQLLIASRPKYTVQRGDSLWRIAQLIYGDGRRWPSIYHANPQLSHSRDLNPGDTLIIPPE